jgi:hypothetical protein
MLLDAALYATMRITKVLAIKEKIKGAQNILVERFLILSSNSPVLMHAIAKVIIIIY